MPPAKAEPSPAETNLMQHVFREGTAVPCPGPARTVTPHSCARASRQHRPGGPAARPSPPTPLSRREGVLSLGPHPCSGSWEQKGLRFPGNKEMFLPSVPRGTLLRLAHVSTARFHSRRVSRRIIFGLDGRTRWLQLQYVLCPQRFGRPGTKRCACWARRAPEAGGCQLWAGVAGMVPAAVRAFWEQISACLST